MENKAKKDLRKIAVVATAGIGVVGVGAVSQGSAKQAGQRKQRGRGKGCYFG